VGLHKNPVNVNVYRVFHFDRGQIGNKLSEKFPPNKNREHNDRIKIILADKAEKQADQR
jgi:hypothetical protein